MVLNLKMLSRKVRLLNYAVHTDAILVQAKPFLLHWPTMLLIRRASLAFHCTGSVAMNELAQGLNVLHKKFLKM